MKFVVLACGLLFWVASFCSVCCHCRSSAATTTSSATAARCSARSAYALQQVCCHHVMMHITGLPHTFFLLSLSCPSGSCYLVFSFWVMQSHTYIVVACNYCRQWCCSAPISRPWTLRPALHASNLCPCIWQSIGVGEYLLSVSVWLGLVGFSLLLASEVLLPFHAVGLPTHLCLQVLVMMMVLHSAAMRRRNPKAQFSKHMALLGCIANHVLCVSADLRVCVCVCEFLSSITCLAQAPGRGPSGSHACGISALCWEGLQAYWLFLECCTCVCE